MRLQREQQRQRQQQQHQQQHPYCSCCGSSCDTCCYFIPLWISASTRSWSGSKNSEDVVAVAAVVAGAVARVRICAVAAVAAVSVMLLLLLTLPFCSGGSRGQHQPAATSNRQQQPTTASLQLPLFFFSGQLSVLFRLRSKGKVVMFFRFRASALYTNFAVFTIH